MTMMMKPGLTALALGLSLGLAALAPQGAMAQETATAPAAAAMWVTAMARPARPITATSGVIAPRNATPNKKPLDFRSMP